ncbi:MAG: hypothetical protein ACYS0G_12835 [Planctomycetota bacterium]
MSVLVATGLALLLLTLLTVFAAGHDFGNINIWIALAIASLAFVAILISFALTDTTEYAPDVDTGNAPLVDQKLGELEP